MQILATFMRKYVAFMDFWHVNISTYTYLILTKDKNSKSTESLPILSVQNIHANSTHSSDETNETQALQHQSSRTLESKDFIDSLAKTESMDFRDSMAKFGFEDSKETIESRDSTTRTESKGFRQIVNLQRCRHCSYITIAQVYGAEKSNWLARVLHLNASGRLYYVIIPLDLLIGVQIDIEKSYLRQADMSDSIVPLHAQNQGLIQNDCEYRYFLQKQTETHFTFQIFCVLQTILQQYATKYAGRILFINPLELFCGVFTLYPHLTRYTIIFQDNRRHALCHYENGFLSVSVVLERGEALQNHYGLIRDFGTIFYCDFSGKPDLLCDFTDITTLFNMPLQECLHLLALQHIRTKPDYVNFFAQAFYSLRSKLKTLIFVSVFILVFCFGSFYYNKYQYHKFLQNEERNYQTQIETLYRKKQQYPFMYERIYGRLLDSQSFHFCLQQDYNKVESIWIQTDCEKQ